MEQIESPWMSIEEAARYIKMRKSFLYQLTHQRKIRYFKPNNKNIFFRREDLDEFMGRYELKALEQED